MRLIIFLDLKTPAELVFIMLPEKVPKWSSILVVKTPLPGKSCRSVVSSQYDMIMLDGTPQEYSFSSMPLLVGMPLIDLFCSPLGCQHCGSYKLSVLLPSFKRRSGQAIILIHFLLLLTIHIHKLSWHLWWLVQLHSVKNSPISVIVSSMFMSGIPNTRPLMWSSIFTDTYFFVHVCLYSKSYCISH